jgi:hypothetical protein
MWKSPRVEMYNEGEADKARQLELDSVKEARCTALVQSARYLQAIRRYHNRNVKERSFSIGDLILRRIQDESGLHKLNSRWEGPFVVKQVTRPGSFFSNKIDPFDWFIPNLLDGLTRGAILTTPRVVALGVVSISCHKHGSHVTMLVFFPNRLDLLVRVTPSLLDGLT